MGANESAGQAGSNDTILGHKLSTTLHQSAQSNPDLYIIFVRNSSKL